MPPPFRCQRWFPMLLKVTCMDEAAVPLDGFGFRLDEVEGALAADGPRCCLMRAVRPTFCRRPSRRAGARARFTSRTGRVIRDTGREFVPLGRGQSADDEIAQLPL